MRDGIGTWIGFVIVFWYLQQLLVLATTFGTCNNFWYLKELLVLARTFRIYFTFSASTNKVLKYCPAVVSGICLNIEHATDYTTAPLTYYQYKINLIQLKV